MARAGLRRDRGLSGPARDGAGHGLHRLRSDGVEPARRLAADRDGARAAAALRSRADRDRRRRHRHDRRSERQVAGAACCCRPSRSRRTSPASARSSTRFLDFDAPANAARIVNNADWLATIDLLAFLRDTGKHFTVNYMLQKESVSRRLESEDGISFTEFSYLLLQAHDFLQLFDRYRLHAADGRQRSVGQHHGGHRPDPQAARREGARPGVAADDDGVGREVREDRGRHDLARCRRTSPFKFYQFWLNTDDRDVVTYLKFFTFLDREAIEALERCDDAAPEKREAQRVLAREVTTLVHGAEQVARAEHASSLLFGEDITTLAGRRCAGGVRGCAVDRAAVDEFAGEGLAIVDLVARVRAGGVEERGAAAGAVRRGVCEQPAIVGSAGAVDARQAIGGRLFVLRKGQKQNHLVRLT